MIKKKLVVIPSIIFAAFTLIIYIAVNCLDKNLKYEDFKAVYIIVAAVSLSSMIITEMYLVNRYVIKKLKYLSDMFIKINRFDLSENTPSKNQDEFTYIETLVNNALFRFTNIIIFMTEVAEWLYVSSSQLKNTSTKSSNTMERLDESYAEIMVKLSDIHNITGKQCGMLVDILNTYTNEKCREIKCEEKIRNLLIDSNKINDELSEITRCVGLVLDKSREQKNLSQDVEDISKIVYRLSEKINCNFKKYNT